jgi:hypothetical protein
MISSTDHNPHTIKSSSHFHSLKVKWLLPITRLLSVWREYHCCTTTNDATCYAVVTPAKKFFLVFLYICINIILPPKLYNIWGFHGGYNSYCSVLWHHAVWKVGTNISEDHWYCVHSIINNASPIVLKLCFLKLIKLKFYMHSNFPISKILALPLCTAN